MTTATPKHQHQTHAATIAASDHSADVVIIGAGFSGIGMGIRLKQAGIHNFIILERAANIGGTWRDHHYPGAACDIASHLYSYSFAPNPMWSQTYPSSAEILAYINNTCTAYQLMSHIRLNQPVDALTYDEQLGRWHIHSESGEVFSARAVVMAQGLLTHPHLPDITGIKDFTGKMMHSSSWDHHYDLAGKRVAVIGTGSSAVQIIPQIVGQVAKLKIFQRTAPWVLPRPNYASPQWLQQLFKALPLSQNAVRQLYYYLHEAMALGVVWNSKMSDVLEAIAKQFLKYEVKDTWLRRQLTPNYRIGCKRLLISNDYYPALQQPNCELITWPIAQITPTGIQTCEGLIHEVDCIICATGFIPNKYNTPFPITGVNGRTLDTEWQNGAYAYKSMNVNGYPNLFMTSGPNSGTGHNSALIYIEAQLAYALAGIQVLLQCDFKQLDVRVDRQSDYNHGLQARLQKTNWNAGCNNRYYTNSGFNVNKYPGFASQYQRQMLEFNIEDYHCG